MRSNLSAGNNTRLQISIQPNLGLEVEARISVLKYLNILLADEAVLALKTQSAQWQVRGSGFFELRTLFSQQYQQLNQISDEIAERVQIMGGHTVSSFQEILQQTRLIEQPGENPGLMTLLADHEETVRYLREDVRKCQDEYEDEGTSALLIRIICLHEKMAWILRSYIEPDNARDNDPGSSSSANPGLR